MKKQLSIFVFTLILLMVLQVSNISAEESNNIFYWSFDEHSMDMSHYMLDGQGDVSYVEGVVGSAVDLRDGSCLLTDEVPIDFDKFTISLWTKIYESENGYSIMLAKGSKTAGHFELYFAKPGGDGSLSEFEIRLWSPDFNDFQTGKYIEYEKWMHIAATYDGSIGKIYLDGEKIFESGVTGGLNDVTDVDFNMISIGALVEQTLPLYGLVDELVITDYVMPEDDIVKLAKSPADAANDIKDKVKANYPEGSTPRPDPTPTPEPTATPEPTPTPDTTITPSPTKSATTTTQANKGISTPVMIGVIVFVTLVVAGCVVFFILKKK